MGWNSTKYFVCHVSKLIYQVDVISNGLKFFQVLCNTKIDIRRLISKWSEWKQLFIVKKRWKKRKHRLFWAPFIVVLFSFIWWHFLFQLAKKQPAAVACRAPPPPPPHRFTIRHISRSTCSKQLLHFPLLLLLLLSSSLFLACSLTRDHQLIKRAARSTRPTRSSSSAS